MKELVILHISDLHFGIENDKSEKTKYIRLRQKEMLDSLVKTINTIIRDTPDWKPSVIVVSGDIAWTGQSEEYQLYKKSFAIPLSKALNIALDHIITCPGNHDIMRDKVTGLVRPVPNIKDSDVMEIDAEQLLEQASHFEGYVTSLCAGIPDRLCQIISFEEWPWVSFLSLNSAWDCRNDRDEERLRVGLPLLEKLIEKVPDENYVITVFHHPHTEIEDYVEEIDEISHHTILKNKRRKWLHISEREPEYAGARCFSSYVEQKSTFILNGHIHKEAVPQKLRKSIQLISGTFYSNDTPQYHCRLLKLSRNAPPCYRDLRHTIGDDSENWEITAPKEFQFDHIAVLLSRKKEQEEKEFQFGKRLKIAQEQYDKDKNIEQFQKVVDEITKELLHEAIVPANTFVNDNTFVSEKTTIFNQTDKLTLKNGGKN